MKNWYRIENAAGGEADIYLFNDIGMFGVSAEQFVAELDAVTAPVVNLHVNSYGGEVFDGFAMFNAIRRHDSRFIAHVDGIAASAATYPTLACDEVRIAKNAMLMIHNPLVIAAGEASDLRKEADVLDKLRDRIANLYAECSGADLAQVIAWMDAETWFDADEAVANGFAHAVSDASADAPMNPQNKRGQYWNNTSSPRARPSDRVKALGLDELLPAAATEPANAGGKAHMSQNVKKAAPATVPSNAEGDPIKWPDEGDVREGVKFGPTGDEYTGTLMVAAAAEPATNATAAEIKAEFAGDRDFILDRIDVDSPMNAHKAAYADRLKAQNKSLRDQLDKSKPGTAGRKPVDLAAPAADGVATNAAAANPLMAAVDAKFSAKR